MGSFCKLTASFNVPSLPLENSIAGHLKLLMPKQYVDSFTFGSVCLQSLLPLFSHFCQPPLYFLTFSCPWHSLAVPLLRATFVSVYNVNPRELTWLGLTCEVRPVPEHKRIMLSWASLCAMTDQIDIDSSWRPVGPSMQRPTRGLSRSDRWPVQHNSRN